MYKRVPLWPDEGEYQLLWEDLANAMTYGCRSHYDMIALKGKPNPPRYPQSVLIETGNGSHCAIMGGKGFFKVISDDGNTVGYTRNGDFMADTDREMKIGKLVMFYIRSY
ncbi:MAG: hypothetical protein LBB43_00725 [Spirochaetaceae bacterium]|jgi:flagellar basal body rod protein FlgF|nr:hypothetical protein [Spirochaetaceae bacterium]